MTAPEYAIKVWFREVDETWMQCAEDARGRRWFSPIGTPIPYPAVKTWVGWISEEDMNRRFKITYPQEVLPEMEWKGRGVTGLRRLERVNNEWRAHVYTPGVMYEIWHVKEEEVEEFLRLFGVRFMMIPVNEP